MMRRSGDRVEGRIWWRGGVRTCTTVQGWCEEVEVADDRERRWAGWQVKTAGGWFVGFVEDGSD